jgi:hypothetical protein
MRPRPVQPPDPSLEAFTRQLAARFAKESSAPGWTAPYVAPARDRAARMAEPEAAPETRPADARPPDTRPRATNPGSRLSRGRPLVLSFLLGAAVAAVCSLYFLSRPSPPPPLTTVVATASPPLLPSSVPAPVPPAPPVAVETPVVATARQDTPPITSTPVTAGQDSAANANDRDRTLDNRNIREIQTLL